MAEKEVTGMAVLGFLALIYLVNQACTTLFPIFRVLTIIALVVAIIISFVESDFALWAWIAFGGLGVLTFIFFLCGPGFANTDLGGSLVDTGNASYEALNEIKEAENTVEEAVKNTSKEIIDATIEATDTNDSSIKATGEIAKVLIDQSKIKIVK